MNYFSFAFVSALLLVACSSPRTGSTGDAGSIDSGGPGVDAGTHDSGASDSSTPPGDAGPVTDPPLHTESEVCARWNADRADNVDGTWNGTGAPTCDPGDMDAAWRARVLKQVNLYRWVAGLAPVTFDDTRNQKAQACALIQTENFGLSHMPPMSDACWTMDGYEASSKSNIAPSAAAHSIESYMVDWGDSNLLSLGHRRWVLDDTIGPFGIGSTTDTSCLWVHDGTAGASYDYLAWPPPGAVPLEAFYISDFGTGRDLGLKDSAWSIQSETIDFGDDVVATITDGGVNRPVRTYVLGRGYGTRYGLGIEPMGWDVDPGHTYHVQVTGASLPSSIVYDVQVVGCGTTIGMDL